MKFTIPILAAVEFSVPTTQYLVSPPDGGIAAPGASADCSAWVQQAYSLSCGDIEAYYGITEAKFEEWVTSQ
tara:strand:+ start:352 stop:567 length:216 start_codon:yes stop_codon:yes gene_type:complete